MLRIYHSPTANRDCFVYDDPENGAEEIPEISQIQADPQKRSFSTSFAGTAMRTCREVHVKLTPYDIVDNSNESKIPDNFLNYTIKSKSSGKAINAKDPVMESRRKELQKKLKRISPESFLNMFFNQGVTK